MVTRAPLRRCFALVLVAGGLVATACGASPQAGTAAAGTTATTFQQPTARQLLVPVEDLRSIVALGYDVREQPVADPSQFSLSELRAPCGAATRDEVLADGVTGIYRSTLVFLVAIVAQPGEAAGLRLIDQMRRDLRLGCPEFTERVGGGPARVELLEDISLKGIGDEGVAWVQRVRDAEGAEGRRIVMAMRQGGRLVLLVALATRPIPSEGFDLVAAAAARAAFGEAAGDRAFALEGATVGSTPGSAVPGSVPAAAPGEGGGASAPTATGSPPGQ